MQDRELCAALRAVDRIASAAQPLRGRGQHETFEAKYNQLADELRAWQREHQMALVRAEKQA